MLDVERGPDVDAGGQQFLHVLPALRMARPRDVGVRKLVDQDQRRPPRQCGVEIESERLAAVATPQRQHLQTASSAAVSARPWVSTTPATTSLPAVARAARPRASRRSCRRRRWRRSRCAACRAARAPPRRRICRRRASGSGGLSSLAIVVRILGIGCAARVASTRGAGLYAVLMRACLRSRFFLDGKPMQDVLFLFLIASLRWRSAASCPAAPRWENAVSGLYLLCTPIVESPCSSTCCRPLQRREA